MEDWSGFCLLEKQSVLNQAEKLQALTFPHTDSR